MNKKVLQFVTALHFVINAKDPKIYIILRLWLQKVLKSVKMARSKQLLLLVNGENGIFIGSIEKYIL